MRFLIAILLLFVNTLGLGQEFEINDKKKVKLKFEYLNNLILIPVQLNGKNLTFLLDSGVQQTLLFSVENEDLSLENIQKMKFTGLGGSVEIEGYVVEGHVPVAAINKMLTEQPKIKGLALPGMPMNSPGMGPEKKGSLQVLELDAQGKPTGVYITL